MFKKYVCVRPFPLSVSLTKSVHIREGQIIELDEQEAVGLIKEGFLDKKRTKITSSFASKVGTKNDKA